MKYSVTQITIAELLEWIKKDKIDLHPPYQRNFVWTLKDQKQLVDSIMRGYPLPNFIISLRKDGTYEMVDGQQRATTISKFVKNEFPDFNKHYFRDIDQKLFLDYHLVFVVIEDVDASRGESLENYFSLVNKRGVHLNTAEVNKAQYYDSPFMILVNEIMDMQGLSELEIFSSKTVQRMNDRSMVEELVAYLFQGAITDKRKAADELLEAPPSDEQIKKVRQEFKEILDVLCVLNKEVKHLNETRFKQRNDLYTLFVFVAKYKNELSIQVLKGQYRFLVFLDKNDYIRPTNDDCDVLKEYAYHCVTQSNSKNARQSRLTIMESLLLYQDGKEPSDRLQAVCEYLQAERGLETIVFDNIDGWKVVNTSQFE